ncbi:L,D-transpeptidase family protein [Sphingomonas nostoxanthinifaciens]|uniref:L,D-transpeptidase family protein n=1 Tax=Sphingomonas nostoxanthinifaciens TaxID=2872652 RepID=UPI001CC1E013|nr:L,D-transpeptidase family protein [Sphingomonas nostoxanthinifaciens]UAK23031.1 L,D-transpeptidase family protein [Sphingomonas nostoxanthinifaciens]
MLATVCPASIAQKPATTPIDPDILNQQVLLDRLGFTPGVIDGHAGMSLTKAIKGLQTARGVTPSGTIDDDTRKLLDAYHDTPATIDVTLTADDLAGPFVGPIPKSEAAQAKLPSLGYSDAMEELAERFHTTQPTLIALNSRDTKLAPGVTIKVPNVRPAASAYPDTLKPEWRAMLAQLSVSSDQPQAAKVVVSKSEGVLRVYDDGGKLVAQFPATMGSTHDPLPIGNWKILGRSYLPSFHFNPKLFWDAKAGETKQTLKAGPNGPVGVVWMDLDKPHYGIHGTPMPENIGRTESHGCIRLTNWDAARLSLMVKPGTPAVFQE